MRNPYTGASSQRPSVESESIEDLESSLLEYKPETKASSFWRHAFVRVLLFVTYTLVLLLFSPWSHFDHPRLIQDDVYSPAQSVVKWEMRTFENALEADNPFKGKPSKELDDAWHELLAPSAIRVSREDLEKINRTSVPILDGSGYMATLDVYHQLHCLKWVRQALNPDYYTPASEENANQHIYHCLDSLRQFIMCKADVALLTYDWMPNFHRPWPNFEIEHKCVNWDSIHQWAVDHAFNGFDEKLIKHPNFHPELGSPFSYAVSGN